MLLWLLPQLQNYFLISALLSLLNYLTGKSRTVSEEKQDILRVRRHFHCAIGSSDVFREAWTTPGHNVRNSVLLSKHIRNRLSTEELYIMHVYFLEVWLTLHNLNPYYMIFSLQLFPSLPETEK